jgi:hypothetical protein
MYTASIGGEAGSQIGALGAVLLVISAWSYVIVVAATWLSGRKIQAPSFEIVASLRPPVASV